MPSWGYQQRLLQVHAAKVLLVFQGSPRLSKSFTISNTINIFKKDRWREQNVVCCPKHHWLSCRLSLKTGQTRRHCCCWRAWSCTRTGGVTLQIMWAPSPRCSASCTSCSYPLRTSSWTSLTTEGGSRRGSRGPASTQGAARRGLLPMISSPLQTQATLSCHRWRSSSHQLPGHKWELHSCALLQCPVCALTVQAEYTHRLLHIMLHALITCCSSCRYEQASVNLGPKRLLCCSSERCSSLQCQLEVSAYNSFCFGMHRWHSWLPWWVPR